MTKRLQVLLEDDELMAIQEAAQRQRQSVAEWVRVALRTARTADAGIPPSDKLRTIRAATEHEFPTGTIEEMLADIERGYGGGP